jgi:hypothetical protein
MTLVGQFRQILAELELLSYGSTANWSPTGRSRGGSYGKPPGSEHPSHEHWRERWERAVWDDMEEEQREATTITRHRRRVIEKAQADLDSYRKRAEGKIVEETASELEARIVREGDGWAVADTALHCRCTTTFVRKARLKAGRSVVTGKAPKDPLIAADDDLRQRALKLKREGVSGRGIRLILGIGGSKLDQLLREAA